MGTNEQQLIELLMATAVQTASMMHEQIREPFELQMRMSAEAATQSLAALDVQHLPCLCMPLSTPEDERRARYEVACAVEHPVMCVFVRCDGRGLIAWMQVAELMPPMGGIRGPLGGPYTADPGLSMPAIKVWASRRHDIPRCGVAVALPYMMKVMDGTRSILQHDGPASQLQFVGSAMGFGLRERVLHIRGYDDMLPDVLGEEVFPPPIAVSAPVRQDNLHLMGALRLLFCAGHDLALTYARMSDTSTVSGDTALTGMAYVNDPDPGEGNTAIPSDTLLASIWQLREEGVSQLLTFALLPLTDVPQVAVWKPISASLTTTHGPTHWAEA